MYTFVIVGILVGFAVSLLGLQVGAALILVVLSVGVGLLAALQQLSFLPIACALVVTQTIQLGYVGGSFILDARFVDQ